MRRIFIPHLGKMGLAYFSPSECEVAHTSRGTKLRPARAAPAEPASGPAPCWGAPPSETFPWSPYGSPSLAHTGRLLTRSNFAGLDGSPRLTDEQVEYQVRDRLSFSRFLGLAIEDSIPDATTLWLFREKLAKAEMIEKLFDRFDQHLAAKGYMARGGQIIDASICWCRRSGTVVTRTPSCRLGAHRPRWKQKPAKGGAFRFDSRRGHLNNEQAPEGLRKAITDLSAQGATSYRGLIRHALIAKTLHGDVRRQSTTDDNHNLSKIPQKMRVYLP